MGHCGGRAVEKGPTAPLGLRSHRASPGSGASPRLCTQVQGGAGTWRWAPWAPSPAAARSANGESLRKAIVQGAAFPATRLTAE